MKIKNIDHLIENIKKGRHEYKIILNGNLVSRKFINLEDNEDMFFIINFVDDSEQTIKKEELFNTKITNIGKAMQVGALYLDIK